MKEMVTLVCDANDLNDIINLQYRAGFFLSIGYGAVYFGEDIDEEGNPVEGTLREDLVFTYDVPKTMGFNTTTDSRNPIRPTIENPSVAPAMAGDPCVGSEGCEEQECEEDEDDYEDTDGMSMKDICYLPRGCRSGKVMRRSGADYIDSRLHMGGGKGIFKEE